MPNPLYVAFVWHMHQPFYKDTESGAYSLPWVRLHATKDYLHLAEVIADYPEIHQTVNFVPSLVEQLQDYAAGRAVDPWLAVSQKTRLAPEDKGFLLENFFSINWDRFVWPVPRYAQLARVREAVKGGSELLSDEFWTDLIVWFNLAWVDPSTRSRDPGLRRLVEKGQSFDRADVETVLAYHRAACGRVIEAYRELLERGQVELSTTPFFHPILPLIIDTASASEARADVSLPRLRFAWPDDAREQMARAIQKHEAVFGQKPRGLWPAEGAVSHAVLELVAEYDHLRWIASDEHVLERALGVRFGRDGYGHLDDPRPLCQPYRVGTLAPAVFFRDQLLSDRIGFVYQTMDSQHAADDLIERLLRIWHRVGDDGQPRLLSIILDGENCWETYPNNGDDFLRSLFSGLSKEPRLKTVTPAEFLDRFGAAGHLEHLPAGSWINANFDVWIGEADQNRAWEYLALARSALAAFEQRALSQHAAGSDLDERQRRRERARLAMLVAEGSDWLWWYYSRNAMGYRNPFDAAFRRHLANVYQAIGLAVPPWLGQPVGGQPVQRSRGILGPVAPEELSGDRQASIAWANAGYVEPEVSTGPMHRGASTLRRLYFGYADATLYLRIETVDDGAADALAVFLRTMRQAAGDPIVTVDHGEGHSPDWPGFTWRIDLPRQGPVGVLNRRNADGSWSATGSPVLAVVGRAAAELKVPWDSIGLQPGDQLQLVVGALRDGRLIERLPAQQTVTFQVTGGSRA